MDKKIFMNEQGMATITCPECETTVTKRIGDYEHIDDVKQIKCSCSCGATFRVTLEKRKFYRKESNFSGKYTLKAPDGSEKHGLLYVRDVSQSGLRFEVNMDPVFEVDDQIWVEFYVDEEGKRLIRKEGIIRGIRGHDVGMEFLTTEHYDEYGKLLLQ
jgi:hypothetical protein